MISAFPPTSTPITVGSCKRSICNRFFPSLATKYNRMFVNNTSIYEPLRHFSSAVESTGQDEKEDLSGSSSKRSSNSSITDQHAEPNNESSTELSASDSKHRRLSQVPISEVLKAKHTLRWVEPVICQTSTIRYAISICIDRGLSGMMVVDRDETTSDTSRERGKVVGLTTPRDLLRRVSAGLKEGKSSDEVLDETIENFMTPISQVIYGRPEETIGVCRLIMAKLGIKCLPILSDGRVEGLITHRDMSDYGLDAKDRGGKRSYLTDISERVGLGVNTSMAEPPIYLRAHVSHKQHPIFMNLAVSVLPHPFKSIDGCGMNQREYGPKDFATDPELSEDAHFVREVRVPMEKGGSHQNLIYMGVADGVGSWREYGVDPREFSRKLMAECDNILAESVGESVFRKAGSKLNRILRPEDILARAYERVKTENIIGSSTACVALFDGTSHQLHFSNLGDCGIVVLRHIDSDVAGSLKRDRFTPRYERKSDLRVAFVSQQQLRSFNHPYQFGWTGEELTDGQTSFKTAADCCTTSIHIRRGDIIVMATDGLFDNVDIDEIAQIGLEWEQQNKFILGGDIAAREKRWAQGNSMSQISAEQISDLSERLNTRARQLSLEKDTDSPFAILAKENDIMWSGGMPDDCTVVAMHVVGTSSNSNN